MFSDPKKSWQPLINRLRRSNLVSTHYFQQTKIHLNLRYTAKDTEPPKANALHIYTA